MGLHQKILISERPSSITQDPPLPYVVDYEVLIEHPRDIEQQVHRKLFEFRKGREWFRCTPEFAVSVVQQIVGDGAIVESFKRADRLKAKRSDGDVKRKRKTKNEPRPCGKNRSSRYALHTTGDCSKHFQNIRFGATSSVE